MSDQFTIHYTRDEARSLLPQLEKWLDQLLALRARLETLDKRLTRSIGFGDDLGGSNVNDSVRLMIEIKDLLTEFARREIQIKDLERGLIDFPAYVAGKEVFLCWEKGEEDVEYWHELESGFSGREPIEE